MPAHSGAFRTATRCTPPRLLVCMSPGSATSTYASKLFPAWFLASCNLARLWRCCTSRLWLADDLRTSYGEHGLLALMRMIARASQLYPIKLKDGKAVKLDPAARYSLRWPAWFQYTGDHKLAQAQSLVALTGGGLMSKEAAVKDVAEVYDIGDVEAEMTKIKADGAEADQRAAGQAMDAAKAQAVAKPAPVSL